MGGRICVEKNISPLRQITIFRKESHESLEMIEIEINSIRPIFTKCLVIKKRFVKSKYLRKKGRKKKKDRKTLSV